MAKKMHIDVFMRSVKMLANTIWTRYYLNYTNLLPNSEKPQIMALQIANVACLPSDAVTWIEDSLIKEGFELHDRETVQGIEVITFLVERDINN